MVESMAGNGEPPLSTSSDSARLSPALLWVLPTTMQNKA